MDSNTVKVAGGWAALIAITGAIYWVGNQKKNKNRRTIAPKSTTKILEPRKEPKEPKAKRAKKDAGIDQETKQSKKKAAQTPKTEEKAYTSAVDLDDKAGDEVDNLEFARQLSNAKSGTIGSSKTQTSSSRSKSVKQTRAQEKKPVVESSDNATAPPSTTGGDADDDESPINSPEVAATAMDPVTNGDISDMLEKPAAGPQAVKPAETQETKKQRQNRQKAEAQRLAREDEEKERKVLEEKQRRTAREAEGRAAKDGSVFMAGKAPSSSAWTASASNGTKATTSNSVDLLDTYEPGKTNGKVVESSDDVFSPSEIQGSQLADEYNGLSEEEQMRLIQEDSADWKTVSKDKRKKKNPGKESIETKEEMPAPESKEFGVPPVIAPTGHGQAWSMKTVHVEPETRKVVEREVEVQDSEWEVA